MKNYIKDKQRLTYLTVIAITLLVAVYLSSQEKNEGIRLIIESAGVFAPLVFIILLTLTYIIAPLSGTPVFFAGYVLFERNLIIYNYFAAAISMIINFWIARFWGRSFVEKFVGEKDMKKVDQFAVNQGLGLLVFARLFLGVLHDFISYAYGLTKINFRKYILVSLLAPIPWTAAWYFYVFDRVHTIGDFTIWFIVMLWPFALIAFIYLKLSKKS